MEGPGTAEGLHRGERRGPAVGLAGRPDVDGVLPVLSENVAVTNPATRQVESRAELAGLDS